MWINNEFKNLSATLLNDYNSEQYLRIVKSAPHPVLITQPSVHLICRVESNMHINCQLQAYNSITIKEVAASLEEEYEDLKSLLTQINNHQTSICKGIPEEKLVTWASRKNLSHILIERFQTKVVFRERTCSYVILETDQADICRSCALLLSSSAMDLHGDEEIECPEPDCDRTFKYQGALEKHILKHSEEPEDFIDDSSMSPKRFKEEEDEESLNHIKLEPVQHDPNDMEFLDRLLDEMEEPIDDGRRRRKKKKKKPATKDFACCDCGRAFYFQKNLFTHVVEAHGKSVDELPNLARVKSEDGIIRKRKRRGKGVDKSLYCDECGVTFKFASGLYNHRKRMHGDTEKKPCPHCDRQVKSCTLAQHIREEHGTPRYACQFCGKGFYYKSFMLNHQKLHTGDYKECVCDLCGAVYKSVQVLNRHVRNAHQDLRDHKCDHCEKAFHNKQRLERHINSQHTKSKLWPCPVCHSKYDRKDNLRTHIRKNHSGVVNPDTVELVPIENDGGFDLVSRKPRSGSSQIISQALFMQQNVERANDRGIFTAHERGNAQERNVHGAQDLLHLKYGEEGHFRPHDQIKREDLGGHHNIRIPFENALMRHEQDFSRQQREEFLRKQQERSTENRLSVQSPPMRDVVTAVRDSAVPMRDVVAAVQHPSHSLAQTIHHIQNSYNAFSGLQGGGDKGLNLQYQGLQGPQI